MIKNNPQNQIMNEKSTKSPEELNLEPCIVIINQMEIDKAKHYKAFEEVFKGLE